MSRYYLENLGCAKNQVDAEVMMASLDASGRTRVDSPGEADLIIVNSCGFIEPAKRESIDLTLEVLAQNPNARVILAGCLSQRYGRRLASGIEGLAAITGNRAPADIALIADRVETADPAEGPLLFFPTAEEAARSGGEPGSHPRLPRLSPPGSAYLKIAEGCDNCCAFCAIPLIRGGLRSRSLPDIVAEARRLGELGVREINLVAQDLASWGRDRDERLGVEALLEALLEVEAVYYRPLYIYPEHFPQGLLDLCVSEERLWPYFDIPMQHGSDRILQAMGRGRVRDRHLGLVERIRALLPQAVIRTSLITGFPGEEDSDVEQTADLLRLAGLDWVGIFTYSREEGTSAYRRRPLVPRATAEERKAYLELVQAPITESRLDRQIGTRQKILIEEPVPLTGTAIGRGYGQAPDVDGAVVYHGGDAVAGMLVDAVIGGRRGIDLQAWPPAEEERA